VNYRDLAASAGPGGEPAASELGGWG
jgi:hypothetical protein